jgi:hypothetical protein
MISFKHSRVKEKAGKSGVNAKVTYKWEYRQSNHKAHVDIHPSHAADLDAQSGLAHESLHLVRSRHPVYKAEFSAPPFQLRVYMTPRQLALAVS